MAFIEYCLAVPANRYGSSVYSPAQLKTIQEVLTLTVVAVFSVVYLQQTVTWNQIVGFALIRGRRVFCLPLAAVVRTLSLKTDRANREVLSPRGPRRCSRARARYCGVTGVSAWPWTALLLPFA